MLFCVGNCIKKYKTVCLLLTVFHRSGNTSEKRSLWSKPESLFSGDVAKDRVLPWALLSQHAQPTDPQELSHSPNCLSLGESDREEGQRQVYIWVDTNRFVWAFRTNNAVKNRPSIKEVSGKGAVRPIHLQYNKMSSITRRRPVAVPLSMCIYWRLNIGLLVNTYWTVQWIHKPVDVSCTYLTLQPKQGFMLMSTMCDKQQPEWYSDRSRSKAHNHRWHFLLTLQKKKKASGNVKGA